MMAKDATQALTETAGYFDDNIEVESFVAMGDRAVLAQYKAALVAGNDPTVGRPAAKSFIEVQVAAAKHHRGLLRRVYAAKKEEHKPQYDSALESVESQPQFDVHTGHATAAAKCAEARHGKYPVQQTKDIDTLYDGAKRIKERFRAFAETLRKKSNGKLNIKTLEVQVEATGKGGLVKGKKKKMMMATATELALKSQERVLEKTGTCVDRSKIWDCSGVCDVVRAGLEYGQVSELLQVLKLIMACDKDQESDLKKTSLGAGAEDIVIVRVKDRFTDPTDGGWADTMINFYFADDPNKHVAELQLTHTMLMTVRTEQGAHKG